MEFGEILSTAPQNDNTEITWNILSTLNLQTCVLLIQNVLVFLFLRTWLKERSLH